MACSVGAPARRAAVLAALWQVRTDVGVDSVAPAFWPALTDDLCRIAARLDECDVADVALAQAAADPNEALSRVARIIYGARQTLKNSLLHADIAQTPTPVIRNGAPPGNAGKTCSHDLRSAFSKLQNAGVRAASVPRRLLVDLRIGDGSAGAVAAMLAASYSDDPAAIIAALCAEPYTMDVTALKFALSRSQAGVGPRQILAGAVAELPGARSREAAIAALAAIDAAQAPSGGSLSLAHAAAAVENAMRAYARSSHTEFCDVDFPELLEAAWQADAVWLNVEDPPHAGMRIACLREAVAHARVAPDLEIYPDDGRACGGIIEASSGPSSPISWAVLARAFELGDTPERAATAFVVRVDEMLPDAAATYAGNELGSIADPAGSAFVWPLPEPAVAFTAPPMTFSASRLNAYVKCPRRWFFDYLCQVLEDPGSLHTAYGRVVHEALEALHQKIRVPGRHDTSVMHERLLRELDAAFGRSRDAFDSQLEYEVSRMRARRMAEQYVRWLATESSRAPMEIVHVELLQRLRHGGHDFIGYIDRIDRPVGGGPSTILDYKTGRIDADADDYLAKIRRGDEAQLALYHAMREAGGDEVARIALVSVRDPRDNVWILAIDIVADETEQVTPLEPIEGVLRARCSRADLQASLAALVVRCNRLTVEGQDHFPAGDDPPCNFCAYARACRERPDDGERIFAR